MTVFSPERQEFPLSPDSSKEQRRKRKRVERVKVNWRTFPFSREKAQYLKRQLEEKVYAGLLIDEAASQKLAQIGGITEEEAFAFLRATGFWKAFHQERKGGKKISSISEEAFLQEEREATSVDYHDIKTCLGEVLSVLENGKDFTFGEIIEKIPEGS